MDKELDNQTDPTRVVVIGAGVGGLAAAVKLFSQGVPFRILEARERTGGRLLSIPAGGGRLDLGATWFWPNESRVNALVRDAGLRSFPQHLEGDMMYQAGTVQRIPGNQLDVASGRIADGMQSITDALESSLPKDWISLGVVVTGIERTVAGMMVHTDVEAVEASHVVLAVPPALALQTIDFGEGLDREIATTARTTPVWMGSTVKVVAVFEAAFWRDSGLAGAAFSHDGPMREIHDMSGPDGTPAALFGFCSIPPGAPAPTEQEVRDQFAALFGPEGARATEIHVHDWRAEEHTSHVATLGLQNYETYGHPAFQEPVMDGRLHWASTETSPIAPGHVEGALVAGARAAEAILDDLRSP